MFERLEVRFIHFRQIKPHAMFVALGRKAHTYITYNNHTFMWTQDSHEQIILQWCPQGLEKHENTGIPTWINMVQAQVWTPINYWACKRDIPRLLNYDSLMPNVIKILYNSRRPPPLPKQCRELDFASANPESL